MSSQQLLANTRDIHKRNRHRNNKWTEGKTLIFNQFSYLSKLCSWYVIWGEESKFLVCWFFTSPWPPVLSIIIKMIVWMNQPYSENSFKKNKSIFICVQFLKKVFSIPIFVSATDVNIVIYLKKYFLKADNLININLNWILTFISQIKFTF